MAEEIGLFEAMHTQRALRYIGPDPVPDALVRRALVPGASAQQPRRGGVLRIAEREAPSLDPHLNISFLTHTHVSLAYGQLVRFPHGPEQAHPTDFSIVPDVAERWTVPHGNNFARGR